MADFADGAPCALWRPTQCFLSDKEGRPIVSGQGSPIPVLTYHKGPMTTTFGELKKACLEHADKTLPWGTPFELRLALPMGLDTPGETFAEDLWRIGWVNHPDMTKKRTPRGIKPRFAYYLLGKRVAGTPIVLDTPEPSGEKDSFLGADRPMWRDRFKRWA